MTVRLAANGNIVLEDTCPLEDAEALQQYLLPNPEARVDWSSCTMMHTAVVQILLAHRPVLTGSPASEFLLKYLAPLVQAQRG
ncbi:MAG TPA: hypothetical protein VFC14_24755 [Burkholderiales bacterium]|nr:hypothetical protein [Burkholderiales bacterium]